MPREDSRPPRKSDRPNGSARRSERATAGSPARRGKSGYGMDSIRRNLRVQLEQRRLLRPGPPPGEDDDKSNGADGSS